MCPFEASPTAPRRTRSTRSTIGLIPPCPRGVEAGRRALLAHAALDGPTGAREACALLARKQGWWASDTATIHFDEVRVPVRHLIGEENRGFKVIMNNFNNERMGMSTAMDGSRAYGAA